MGIKHKWEVGLLFFPPVFSLVLSVPFSFPICWLDFKPDFFSFSNCLYCLFVFLFVLVSHCFLKGSVEYLKDYRKNKTVPNLLPMKRREKT